MVFDAFKGIAMMNEPIYCIRCNKEMTDDDWYCDEPICFSCYEIQADMIYEQGREEGWK